ncbi:T9SS type A sorting domain-containing protein [Lewinella cohaerens]|uniref:T9SS type A sorting domain-containing protein n=1 Tax=Lewinella cohaerens TaxID=70995 RepID=UPI00036BB3B2|nr:T9SS type A sorting domain-containing protein [Lewinella cohaerens]
MKTLITLLITTFSFFFLTAQNDICQIDLPSTRVAAYANGEQVTFSFEYTIDEPGGVRIFARPFTNGNLTPGYGASGSPIYSGDGTGSAFFTINGGNVVVDEIRFLITTADQTATLREFYIPVTYQFGENGANNFSFTQPQEIGSLLLGEQVNISFDYNVSHPGGARIFVRPFTDGNLTPGYGASGSPIFSGTGSHTANFSINSGNNIHVDALRVTILNESQTQTLNTFFIPVNWYWSTVKISDFHAAGGNYFANGDNVTIEYDYETTEAAGVRIFPRPFTNDGLTPGYAACGSGIYTNSGSSDCNFTINGANRRVDHIRFQATNANQTEVLLEMLQPTDLFFGNVLIENLVTCPPSPARLLHGERVNGYFDYTNSESQSGRFFFRPATNGSLSPGYAAAGSPAYPVGSNAGDSYFTITSGDVIVDQIHFLLANESQSEDWGTYRFNVHYQYGDAMVSANKELAALPEHLQWQIAPNPAQQQTTLYLRSEQSEEVSILIMDAYGKVLQQPSSLQLLAGQEIQHTVDLENLGLPSGLYLVQLRGETFQSTQKLIVQ